MELLFLIGGVLIGTIIASIRRSRERIHGVIHIDHQTNQCVFNISSEEVSNPAKKIAVFVINHDANISREEQGL